jgi:ferredoxin
MIEIRTDENACQGYGNCVLNFPEAFDLSPSAVVELKLSEVPDSDADKVRAAIAECPAAAISSSLDA